MLHQNYPIPKQVDECRFLVDLANLLLEGRYAAAADVEQIKKRIPEGFRFSVFTDLILPFFTEGYGSQFDLIPTEGNRQGF